MNKKIIYIGIWLTSLAGLMLELSLTRLFSATMYHHYAFMAISLALFGSAASGVFVFLVQQRLQPSQTGRWLAMAARQFAMTSVLALVIILKIYPRLDLGVWSPYRLVLVYIAAALPFFFAGCAITLAITRLAGDICRLYLFDLAGAAAGCLLLIPVLDWIGAINAVLLVAAMAGLASLIFSHSTSGGREKLAMPALVAAGLIGLLIYNGLSNHIDIQVSKGRKERKVLFSKWNSFSRITVERDPARGKLDIIIDSDATSEVAKHADDGPSRDYLRAKVETLAYRLKEGAKVLIIGPGGGNDVKAALVFGQGPIDAVEVNSIIARDVMSTEPFKSYSGAVYEQPGVRLIVDEGRSFIRSSRDKYDIIQGTMVDTWAATAAGAFALAENNLYTVEAFRDYASHLTDDGILTMTRWYFEPPDQLLRLVSLTQVMMKELGIGNPERHIIMVRDVDWEEHRSPATFIFKKSEFTDREVTIVEGAAKELGFQILYTPLTRPDNAFTRLILASEPAAAWKHFEINIEPTRDNNPFFFNSVRLSNLGRALRGGREWQKANLGTFILFALLGITAVLVGLFILAPLGIAHGRALAKDTGTNLAYLLYFGCLGAGFIIVEVAMTQKFILFLGHPVHSLAVVLFSLLLFSGVGSWLSGRFDDGGLPRSAAKCIGGLVVLVIVYMVVLPPIFYGLVHLPQPFRILIAVGLLIPLGVSMGIPMPAGIRMLNRRAPHIIPWAWGVNGATSVMGSVAAVAIAILTGFNQALLVGAGFYLLAVFFLTRPGNRKPEMESWG